MKEHERAAQLWPLLVLAARNQQILSYGTVRHLTGLAAAKVGPCLGYILGYCIDRKLPLLSSIVVNETTGLPGDNFMHFAEQESLRPHKPAKHTVSSRAKVLAELNVFKMQSRVFAYDWFKKVAPSLEELEAFTSSGKRKDEKRQVGGD